MGEDNFLNNIKTPVSSPSWDFVASRFYIDNSWTDTLVVWRVLPRQSGWLSTSQQSKLQQRHLCKVCRFFPLYAFLFLLHTISFTARADACYLEQYNYHPYLFLVKINPISFCHTSPFSLPFFFSLSPKATTQWQLHSIQHHFPSFSTILQDKNQSNL